MILASRDVEIDRGPNSVKVPIDLHMPEPFGSRWLCRFDIGWPEGKFSSKGAGPDNMGAIILALKVIAIELYASRYGKEGRLSWYENGGYGFPLPPYMQDAAIGDDQRY